ncbi:hypothetical protein H7100_03625 [Candidatus Saccharibacteria bacterium]|nr:hypothetical protein [Candidatus Saccharibacteria bacterium]
MKQRKKIATSSAVLIGLSITILVAAITAALLYWNNTRVTHTPSEQKPTFSFDVSKSPRQPYNFAAWKRVWILSTKRWLCSNSLEL